MSVSLGGERMGSLPQVYQVNVSRNGLKISTRVIEERASMHRNSRDNGVETRRAQYRRSPSTGRLRYTEQYLSCVSGSAAKASAVLLCTITP